jgi:hypothetical protein
MPFDLGTIEHDIAVTTAEYGRHSFVVRYRPSRYSDTFHKAFTEKAARDSVNYYLSELLVDWELTRDGAPIPISPEGIATVVLPIKLAVVKAVEADVMDPTTQAESPAMPAPTPISSNGGPPAARSDGTIGLTAFPIGSGSAT